MLLLPPNFISFDELKSAPIDYIWNEWNPYQNLGEINPETEHLLSQVSDRACLAFAISCAEWVVFRLHYMLEDTRPLQFIEACWAFEMSSKYRCPPESNEEEWSGNIRGPVDLALMTILNTIYAIEDESTHIDASFSELIPLHILPKKDLFNKWRKKVLERLIDWYPKNSINNFGDPIPREALDIYTEITINDGSYLVDSFLKRPTLSSNPFLNEPIDNNP